MIKSPSELEPQETTTQPSYAPFILALGITMIFWGAVTSPVMSIGGAVLLVWALWMWISQIAKSWRNQHA
ncbi:MAG TPA: hypothetical protein VKK61_06270 [Tepidisphaeraceae bacterium]|nr:hypothetical protein [Tepidisphaeraceae bacterium]